MSVYHQMGHDSENLLTVEQLSSFRGAILRPVNYDAADVASQVAAARKMTDFETIFDPQLYVPNSERGCLRDWSYFPTDVDTADLSSEAWWQNLTEQLAHASESIHPHWVCSPAALPRVYTDDYFTSLVQAGAILCQCLAGTGVRPVQTAVVGLNDLAVADRPLAIASILSGTKAERIYLVFIGTVEPRREMREVEELKGAMRLIAALEAADIRVLVGFSSSDLLLWKHAGGSDCASGKFFNLRRFTRARFEEPGSGGGQLPYWFEEALIAFLRESDILRARKANLISDTSLRNPFAQDILQQLDKAPGTAWLARSWRQYLWWFADVERRITAGGVTVPELLKSAEETWRSIEDTVLMEEPANDGGWLRSWRRACIEYQAP